MPGFIPIVEMPAIAFQLRQRIEHIAAARRQFRSPEKTEIPSRGGRDEQHADVGWRGAMTDLFMGRALVIVRRQPIVLRPGEPFEEIPRTAGQQSQELFVACTQRCSLGLARPAAEEGDFRRHQPRCDKR